MFQLIINQDIKIAELCSKRKPRRAVSVPASTVNSLFWDSLFRAYPEMLNWNPDGWGEQNLHIAKKFLVPNILFKFLSINS